MKVVQGNELRKGNTIILDGQLFLVIEHSFNKTAMRGAIVKVKIKNLETGSITLEDLSNKKIEIAIINKSKAFFSHQEGDFQCFLYDETFEELKIATKDIKWESNFLEGGMEIGVNLCSGKVVNIELPEHVTLTVKVVNSSGGGSSQTRVTLESGYCLLTPHFVKEGEKILVSTVNGKYKSK